MVYGLENPQRVVQCLQESNFRLAHAIICESSEDMEKAIPLVVDIFTRLGTPIFEFLSEAINAEFSGTSK